MKPSRPARRVSRRPTRHARPAPGHKSRRVAKLATIPRARAVSLLEMPRAPGPLPPWAKALEAALRFIGQHLARLRHQLGRQLAVARRGPKRLAIGAPPPENVSLPEPVPKLDAEPAAEGFFTALDALLVVGALAVVAVVA